MARLESEDMADFEFEATRDDGVALRSAAHPKGSIWNGIKCYFLSFWWPRRSSTEQVEIEIKPKSGGLRITTRPRD